MNIDLICWPLDTRPFLSHAQLRQFPGSLFIQKEVRLWKRDCYIRGITSAGGPETAWFNVISRQHKLSIFYNTRNLCVRDALTGERWILQCSAAPNSRSFSHSTSAAVLSRLMWVYFFFQNVLLTEPLMLRCHPWDTPFPVRITLVAIPETRPVDGTSPHPRITLLRFILHTDWITMPKTTRWKFMM